ncbi:MAG: glutamine amidotransferase [Halobacteriales archaeon]|nr:glutamine amidotransferase [Halobacteriales archaeon]
MQVLYVGDEKLNTRQFFVGVESVQQVQRRVEDYRPLMEALESFPHIDVEHMHDPDILSSFPATPEELLAYDALIISDLTRDTFLPHFYPDAIPGPNRVKTIAEYVKQGGGLLYCGGWMTYQGYRGVGNWHGTPVADVLPIEIQPIFDDRVETPEGSEITVYEPDHPIMQGIDWEAAPPLYGYNRTAGVKDGATHIADIAESPLLAVDDCGDGRVVAYTSDPGPQWGKALHDWDGYPEFWRQALEWATRHE